jgi:hypothetical protein
VGVEIGERDAEGEGLLVGLLGGWYADNVVELALAQKLANAVTACLAVELVPMSSTMPGSTYSTALQAMIFLSSSWVKMTGDREAGDDEEGTRRCARPSC